MKTKKIQVLSIYIAIVAVVAVIAGITLFRLEALSTGMRTMQEITEEYIGSQQAVSNMREASDYLTMNAREYVFTGDQSHLDNYLEEVNRTKRRDNAVETLRAYRPDDESFQSLEAAVKSSNELAEVELYAMRLRAENDRMEEDALTAYFQDTVLTAEDGALPGEEKLAKAQNMLFDDHYQTVKERIMNESYASLEQLIENTRQRQLESYTTMTERLREIFAMLFVILAASFASLLLTALLVVVPLSRSVGYIREHKKLPLKGSAEYVYLAEAYNTMLDNTREHQRQLSYEATHDELTGLYNRKFYERIRRELADEDTAMLIVDVDYFKSINDTYGHETGDAVLRKVAAALSAGFRNEDYVCRIGGDEFVVIMRNIDSSLEKVIEDKIERLRRRISENSDPAPTLSIGVAFSEGEDPETVFRKADEALYKVKEAGRNGYRFYEEDRR